MVRQRRWVASVFFTAIDTDGLRTINAFGLDAFIPKMNQISRRTADIEVTGRFSGVFKE